MSDTERSSDAGSNAASDHVILNVSSGVLTSWNAAAAEVLGLGPGDRFRPVHELLRATEEAAMLAAELQRERLELASEATELWHRAFHDPLTNLANRNLLRERAASALEQRGGVGVGLLLIELDGLKAVNDALGHSVGDRLLIAVADRLRTAVGDLGTVARPGGGFAVLLDGINSREDAERVAVAIIETLSEPFGIEGRVVFVSPKIGIAMGDSGRWADELLRNADVAMATAKSSGKNRVQHFDPDMHVAVIERHELIADLQRAVDRDEFELHYQPIVDVASGKVCALEALVRWNHPVRGMVPPDQFIPAAEETGLILPMGRLILQKACAQAKDWQERLPGHDGLCMGINLSARQLQQVSFVGDTMQVIAESGVRPSTLILEITESVLMHDTESHIAKLSQLKSLGLRLAMDDFGTGYSSLSFLSQLPIDILKIAKPFVEGLGRSTRDQAFAAAIVRLGQTVGMSLIAEGVERVDQLEELRRLGCDMVQGWYFARAGDAASTEALLMEGVEPGARKVIPFPA